MIQIKFSVTRFMGLDYFTPSKENTAPETKWGKTLLDQQVQQLSDSYFKLNHLQSDLHQMFVTY